MFMKILLPMCSLAHLARAHMIMNTPVPYNRSVLKGDNGPLKGDGTDFPCRLLYDPQGASNVYALGSTNKLTFIGQAVHGGGSCQVSITYDAQPSRDSVWKVIKSIEGGCPAQNQPGNMGEDAGASDPYGYEFTIPFDIPAGNGTIAWTWFNKIGNREMYMNCGPLTLTGAGGTQANYDALPDMFVANIGNGCYVPDSKDVLFPHPGNVTQMNGATNAFAPPTPTNICGVVGARPTEPISTTLTPSEASQRHPVTSKTGHSTSQTGYPTSQSAYPTSQTGYAPWQTGQPTDSTSQTRYPNSQTRHPFSRTGYPTDSASWTRYPATPRTTYPTSQTQEPARSSYSSKPSSVGGGLDNVLPGTPCIREGLWNCIDGASFQHCASGMWSTVQRLATGTSCTPGLSTNFAIYYTNPNLYLACSDCRLIA